jgi:hypothetical protein
MRNMRNPFQYGGVVSGEAFCNRKREIADLLRAMENHEKLFVFSERRYGKTSLVQAAIQRLPRKQYICAYIDLWPTDGEPTFVGTVAKAITEAMSTSTEKLLDNAKALFSRLTPTITSDEEGKPSVSFGLSKPAHPGPELDEVLGAPAKIAAEGRRQVVVVFDEFQQILEYGSDLVERKLRSIVQKQANVAYLFLGSRKHLIQKMFMDKSRPLYRAGGHYPLGPIAVEHWLPFIQDRFLDAKKRIADDQIRAVCRMTEGHPFYTQHLCHALWELCDENAEVTVKLVETAVGVLLNRESHAYTMLWESLATNQRRFLKGLASEPLGVKPFAAEFIQRYDLGSASNAQRAVDALLERDIIDREDGTFVITDRFFRIWVQRVQVS